MSFRIDTNIASLQTQEYLRITSDGQAKTIGRVTSGRRILSSGDDAAGAEGIRFLFTLKGFKVAAGTNEAGTAVVTSAAVGSGSTANIGSQDGAELAVTALAEAVFQLGDAQAVVGRGQNQFSFAINLASNQLTNIAAAESRIRDADFAEEAANLTKAQILLQAGISALAQANSAPQQVFSLLQI